MHKHLKYYFNKVRHKFRLFQRKRLANILSFDGTWYLAQNPDVKIANINAFDHYLNFGIKEGRPPNLVIKLLTDTINRYLDENHPNIIYSPSASHAKDIPIHAIAFYLPQFHTIPENDKWWGKGFTEWTNVRRGKPMFEGHYQPHIPHSDLGYYDLSNPDVLPKQAAMASKFGIYGFCFYYYWFNGKRLLEKPIEQLLSSGKPDFPFCFCWANENWTRRWDGADQDILIEQVHTNENDKRFIYDILPTFRDTRYIRIEGKPLLLVYRPELIPNLYETIQAWREICAKEGIGEIHLAYVHSFSNSAPQIYGFDSAVLFPPHLTVQDKTLDYQSMLNKDFKGGIFEYNDAIYASLKKEHNEYILFRGIMPSWDNTARRMENGKIYVNSSPEAYKLWLEKTIALTRRDLPSTHQYIFINAWNEWAEGAHLEPDSKYHYAYLEVTRDVLKPSASHIRQLSVFLEYWNNIYHLFQDQDKQLASYTFLPEYNHLFKLALRKGCKFHIANGAPNATLNDNTSIINRRITLSQLYYLCYPKPPVLKVCFVILQFNQIEFTKTCITSLQQLDYSNVHADIVIVDNNSQDGVIEETKKYFQDMANVILLFNKENCGYARGNNIGYQYAREQLSSHFVIVLNNDIVIPDKNFVTQCINLFNEYAYSILGPDIRGKNIPHTNPWSDYIFTFEEWDELKLIAETEKIHYESTGKATFTDIGTRSPNESILFNPILQGAAYIFSPIFLQSEPTIFDDRTFLYGEEFILATNCLLTGHLSIYSNSLYVIHHEGASTQQLPEKIKYKAGYDNRIFAAQICKLLLKRHHNAQLGRPISFRSPDLTALLETKSNHILFDLLFCQSGFHGGGEYGKSIFNTLAKSIAVQGNIKLWGALNPTLFIDEWIITTCKNFSISIISVDSFDDIVTLVNTDNFTTFFTPTVAVYTGYEYMKTPGKSLKFNTQKTRILGGLLDIRDLELADAQKIPFQDNNLLIKQLFNMYKEICQHNSIHSLITISDYSAKSIKKRIPLPLDHLKVLYPPMKNKPHPEPFKDDRIDFLTTPFALVLNVMRFEKNGVAAIKAFDQLFSSNTMAQLYPLKVLLTGIESLDKLELDFIKNKSRFITLTQIPTENLEFLYKYAKFLVYPSYNEGFGYPPIEAMYYSTPSIVSNVTAMPEICGDAAIYCDPYDIESIKNAIITMIISPPTKEIMRQQINRIANRQLSDVNTLISNIMYPKPKNSHLTHCYENKIIA